MRPHSLGSHALAVMTTSVEGHPELRLGFNLDRMKELRATQVTQLGLEMLDTPMGWEAPLHFLFAPVLWQPAAIAHDYHDAIRREK